MEANHKSILNYTTEDGKEPFREWLNSLRDKTTIARIRSRLERVEQGNLGDIKAVGSGVSEFRFTFGSGFRVYFGQDGDSLIILLVGGDKSSQDKDIGLAQVYWTDYLRRTQDGKKIK
jgi:putative addiction module killer protein